MYLIIERLDGTTYRTDEQNMKIRKFSISSPVMKHTQDEFDNRHGFVDLGTVYTHRNINADIKFSSIDNTDNVLVQNEIFSLFDSREPFYLIDSRQIGKRYLCKCDTNFTPEQRNAYYGEFSIQFKSQPFAESRGTTLDAKTFDSEIWQVGQGLTSDKIDYTHTTTTFQIYNASSGITIDPRFLGLVITFTGASTNLTIDNQTTGDTWSYTGSSNSTDVIKLDGIRSTKNNLSIFGNTNRKLITIASGYNDFVITGATDDFSISFDFRFHYL